MQERDNRFLTRVVLCLFVNALAIMPAVCQRHEYEGYYLRSANFPSFANLWTPCGGGPLGCRFVGIRTPGLGDGEVQGVTHDSDNWYFTWTFDTKGYLWKSPVNVPLDDNVLANPSVIFVDMTQFHDLDQARYWHWADPDHYRDKHSGIDYIVVPMTAPSICSNDASQSCRADCECGVGNTCISQTPIIGIFRARELGDPGKSLVAYGKLTAQTSTGWCAIDPHKGDLYTSEDFDYTSKIPTTCLGGDNNGMHCAADCECPGSRFGCVAADNCNNQDYHFTYRRELLRYKIPWDMLPSSGYIGEIPLTPMDPPLQLLSGNGEFLELYNMQGGEFSPSGELLYISAGSGCCFDPILGLGGGVGQQYALDGLHVFDTHTWREVKRSYNHDPDYPNTDLPRYFDYYYPLGCDGAGSWSPEGLTIWDLDNGRAPNISGQLHVLLFKFRKTGLNREVFEHFGGRLYVDSVNGADQPLPTSLGDGPLPGGLLTTPFKTFGYAYNGYPAWDGAEIVLQAGSYPETGRFSTRVRLVSRGGVATIGK